MTAAERFPARKEEFSRAARPYLVKAYQIDNSDFRLLFAYARSRSVEPAYPNDNDINALLGARALAPSVSETSLWVGAALMRRGRAEEATNVLAAVANSPHDTRIAKAARAVLDGQSLDEALAEHASKDAKTAPATPPKSPAA